MSKIHEIKYYQLNKGITNEITTSWSILINKKSFLR